MKDEIVVTGWHREVTRFAVAPGVQLRMGAEVPPEVRAEIAKLARAAGERIRAHMVRQFYG